MVAQGQDQIDTNRLSTSLEGFVSLGLNSWAQYALLWELFGTGYPVSLTFYFFSFLFDFFFSSQGITHNCCVAYLKGLVVVTAMSRAGSRVLGKVIGICTVVRQYRA